MRIGSTWRKTWLVAVVALLLPWLGGCFVSDAVITLRPDGSGRLECTQALCYASLKSLKGNTDGKAEADSGDPPPATEEDKRKAEADLGEGVTCASLERFKDDKLVGVRGVLDFKDISKLRLPMMITPQQQGSAGAQPQGVVTFRMEQKEGGSSLLTAVLPTELQGDLNKMSKGSNGGADVPPFMKDFRIRLVVRPEGEVVSSSSPFVQGKDVTLIEVDVQKVTANPEAMAKLESAHLTTPEEGRAFCAGIDGVHFLFAPEATIEFRPSDGR